MKLQELCEICRINESYLEDLVEYDVITVSFPLEQVDFDVEQLSRIKAALRLQRDLEVNMASVALILDLVEELNDLRTRAAILEKHLIK
jgi:chaperone modulatory protein CbpM